jgi:23S rRNA (guanosine2251-2'-O)-methyltransferase
MKLDAKKLRLSEYDPEVFKQIKRNPVYIIVDNVLDTYNIGSIFRLADAVAVDKIYLCAGTETPPHHRIKKASINTTEWVPWEYAPTAVEAISKLKSQNANIQIVSIEQNERSTPYDKIPYTFPIALIIGHETDGVSKEAMDTSDYIAELPMWGINISLNVMVSLGIMLYKVMEYKR